MSEQTRERLARRFRDWVHGSSLSQCDAGADTCPDWPLAYELADIALGEPAPPQPQTETSYCERCSNTRVIQVSDGCFSASSEPCPDCAESWGEPAPAETPDAVQDEPSTSGPQKASDGVEPHVLASPPPDATLKTADMGGDSGRTCYSDQEIIQSLRRSNAAVVRALTNTRRRAEIAETQLETVEAQLTEAIREREEAERKLAAATDNGVRLSNFYRGER